MRLYVQIHYVNTDKHDSIEKLQINSNIFKNLGQQITKSMEIVNFLY